VRGPAAASKHPISRFHGIRTDNGHEWLRERLLAPFLDGLDEVAPEHQEPCVHALNRFQQEYRPRQIVVCCRRSEYENNAARLQLNGAIDLLPLADDDVHRFLTQMGRESLWRNIGSDRQSLDLARSPLLLAIMTIAHEETRAAFRASPARTPISEQSCSTSISVGCFPVSRRRQPL
jgi:predicted NACHT family NTPase